MKKSTPAFIAALLITILVGGGMFLIGQSAVGTSTAKAEAAATAITSANTVVQYQQAVAQYQTRETQYQAQLQQAVNEITTANQQLQSNSQQIQMDNQQIQQYQSLLSQLQSNGLITIAGNGTVTINQANRFGFSSFFSGHDGDNH